MPMKPLPAPTLDDLCAAMARFLNCLERADLDTLAELYDRVTAPKSRSHRVAYLVQAEINTKAKARPATMMTGPRRRQPPRQQGPA